MYIASAKSWSASRASYQPSLMDSCLNVGHTRFGPVCLVDELVQGVLNLF